LRTTAAIGTFDGREAVKARAYYQVLLGIAKCFPHAIGGIPSQEPVAYYKLLRLGVDVEWGQPASVYRAMLVNECKKRGNDPPPLEDEDAMPLEDVGSDASGDGVMLADPDQPPAGPKAKAGPSGPKRMKKAAGAPPRELVPAPKVAPSPPVPVPLPPVPPAPIVHDPPPEVDDGVMLGEEEDELRPRRRKKQKVFDFGGWHESLWGCAVKYNEYEEVVGSGRIYRNWTLKCDLHDSCVKTMGSIKPFPPPFNDLHPLLVLHAWRCVPWPRLPGVPHNKDNPSADEVQAMADAHKDELEGLMRRVRGL